MTIFENTYHLFYKIIQLFNKRTIPGEAPCKCHHLEVTLNFIKTYKTDPEFDEQGWKVIFASPQLGDRRFFGETLDKVECIISEVLLDIGLSTIESMIANQTDWFKSEDQEIIRILYREILLLKDMKC